MAVDGRLKGDDTCLASSTLLADEEDKDIFGLVISYSVRVKLFLGALAGDLVAELPFVLMNPRLVDSVALYCTAQLKPPMSLSLSLSLSQAKHS